MNNNYSSFLYWLDGYISVSEEYNEGCVKDVSMIREKLNQAIQEYEEQLKKQYSVQPNILVYRESPIYRGLEVGGNKTTYPIHPLGLPTITCDTQYDVNKSCSCEPVCNNQEIKYL